MTESDYDAIVSEIAESDISARDFRVVNDILRKLVEVKNGYDSDNPPRQN